MATDYPFPIETTQGMLEKLSVNVLVYGKPSTGKTHLCSTAPDPFLLSFEEGRRTLTEFDIPSRFVKTEEQFDTIEEWLKQDQEFPFKTLCIDSLSSLGGMLLRTYLPQSKDDRKAYGKEMSKVLDFVKNIVENQNYNTYMICEETFLKDENGKFFYGPFIPGEKGSIRLPFIMDSVMRLKVRTIEEDGQQITERKLLTQLSETEIAKTQVRGIERLVEPNLTELFINLKQNKTNVVKNEVTL